MERLPTSAEARWWDILVLFHCLADRWPRQLSGSTIKSGLLDIDDVGDVGSETQAIGVSEVTVHELVSAGSEDISATSRC